MRFSVDFGIFIMFPEASYRDHIPFKVAHSDKSADFAVFPLSSGAFQLIVKCFGFRSALKEKHLSAEGSFWYQSS